VELFSQTTSFYANYQVIASVCQTYYLTGRQLSSFVIDRNE